MGREYRVLSRLWKAFDKAPHALLYCDDETVIGAPFFVMERKDGVVVRETVPEIFGGGADVDANSALSRVVMTTLAEFHAVDPAACGLDDLGRPEGYLERQVNGWLDRWERARHEDNPLAEEVGRWLRETMPTSPPATLLHNDWRLDNMAVSPDDPSVCVAVYDWDMATRGDPLTDLGTLFGSWHHPDEIDDRTHSLMPVTVPGWMRREEAVAVYAETSGVDLTDIDWYIVFGTWKLGVILQQIYIRYLRGQTSDERFASMGDGAARLIELAAARRPG
jgi:aminoglycoside phosphotransferase (APT) family kinase protein